ncbi:MAG: glycerate kinase [Chloroflexi bacterium]|nr:MAG: glycerate kinase [Chloroflexota bacterium]
MAFLPDILTPAPDVRRPIVAVLEAALAAVDPYHATRAFLRREGDTLIAGSRRYDLARFRRVLVIGAGKAGAPMAQAVESVLGDRIAAGLVVVKTGHGAATQHVEIAEAAHPRPDAAGVDAGQRILALAQDAGPDDLVIALLSGGGSALLVAPAPGISLADMQAMTDALLASGATIHEINCLRKHCDSLKGGQLARAAAPATLLTLALSDVVGSPLDVIASGPTVPDATTWEDAWTIVRRYDLENRLPHTVLARLQLGRDGQLPDTPKPDDPVFARSQTVLVADNRVAAQAAAACAAGLGYHPLLLTTYLEGEAAQVAKVVVALGREILAHAAPVAPPACLILGGETTVTLNQSGGMGGRNQELALAAALALDSSADTATDDTATDAITVVSLATDGTDGPTDSAGGLVDGGTVRRGRAQGLDAEDHLRRHDAYPFLLATHDLLRTGPTQTNVNDLVFVFVGSPPPDQRKL